MVHRIGFPRQKLPSSAKTREWFQQCVDAICNQQHHRSFATGRTSKHEKQINYDLYNSKYREEDFVQYTDPRGEKGKYGDMPARMQNYNIIRDKVELLKGEEILRPFFYMARGSGGEVNNLRKQKKKELLLQYVYQKLNEKLGLEQQEEGQQPMLPEQIERYMSSEYLDPREITANQLLQFAVRTDELEEKFNRGWEDALIAAEEIYKLEIINGHPSARLCNPINMDCELDDDHRDYQKAQWVREERWLSPSTILDNWAEQLQDDDVRRIDEGDVTYYRSHGFSAGEAFFETIPSLYAANNSDNRPENGILVTTVCWRGMEKYGVVSYPDPQTGEWQETIVDDTFALNMQQRNEGWSVEWHWRTVIYEGTRIGADLYVDLKPLEYQLGVMPYVGHIYNSRNSKAMSLVDLCKHHQYYYMVIMWHIEMAMHRNKGKKTVIDLAQFPKSQGMSFERQQFFMETYGIIYINSMEESGKDKARSTFNGYTSIDMSSGQEIQQLIMMLNKIEEQIDTITGVSPQRRGQIMASETVGGVERSTAQSSAITESWFNTHALVKKAVLTQWLEVAKVAYADGATLPLMVDDIYTSLIQVDPDTYPDSDYTVHVGNNSKDVRDLQKMEAVAAQMAANQALDMSTYTKLLMSRSVSEFQHYVAKAEQMARENAQASEQAEQEARMQEVQMKVSFEREKMLNENEQKELDRQNDIQKVTISTLRGKDGPSDLNSNGVADGIEHAQLALEISAQNAATLAEAGKQSLEKAKLQSSHEVAMKKMEADMEKTTLAKDKLERETAMFVREQEQQDKVHADSLAEKQRKQQELVVKATAEKEKLRLQEDKQRQEKELEEKRLAQEAREKEKDRKLQIKLKNKDIQANKEQVALEMQQREHEHQTDVELVHVEAKTKQVEANTDIKLMNAKQQNAEHSLQIQKEKSKIKIKPKPKTT